ncbi:hypothetical protein FRC01_005238 [Tulasnella sp. 417]|nr:hypothetical protein FRC01_005238 [Tulasnella sp. 417]
MVLRKSAIPQQSPLYLPDTFLAKGKNSLKTERSDNPHETSALLIDFNNAEIPERWSDGKRVGRTGTAVFIARAVQLGCAMTFPSGIRSPTPESPCPYSKTYPERLEKFKPEEERDVVPRIFPEPSNDSDTRVWRHELDHDVESVFWLIFYWALTAQPKEDPNELMDPGVWGSLVGKVEDRHRFILGLATEGDQSGPLHSAFQPLMKLIRKLAAVLRLDRHWLDNSHQINDPEYIVEVFHRLILQFILDNRGKVFMGIEVDRERRSIQKDPHTVGLSSTTSQTTNSENADPASSDDNPNERDPRTHSKLENYVEEDEALSDVDDTVDDTEGN